MTGLLQESIDRHLIQLEIERGLSNNSIDAYRRDLERYASYLSATHSITLVSEIRRAHVDAFLQSEHKRQLSPRSIARCISALRGFHLAIIAFGLADSDPTDLLPTPNIDLTLPDVLTQHEVLAILEAASGTDRYALRDRAALEMLYATGMRVTELTTLRIPQVLAETRLVRVIGKGNKERLVPVGSHALAAYHRYLADGRPLFLKKRIQTDVVFLNNRGGGLTRMRMWVIVRDYARKAGIEREVHPHTLRHCFASHLIEAGADIRAVQEMLGHVSITTTDIYTHLDRAYLREVHATCHPRAR